MLRRELMLMFAAAPLLVAAGKPSQIVVDGSVGKRTVARLPSVNGNVRIEADEGSQAGFNLFHSFKQFDVPANTTATFAVPQDGSVNTIIARVTGGKPSKIAGQVNADSTVNLFFLNPSGVIFSRGAEINVGGSVIVSTADMIKDADGNTFNTHFEDDPALITSPPASFGFLTPRAANITVEGGATLMVDTFNRMTLMGGDIRVDNSTISAPRGNLGLVAVRKGQVNLDISQDQIGAPALSPAPTVSHKSKRGDVFIRNNSSLDVTSAQGPGVIDITGRDMSVSESTVVAGIVRQLTDSPGDARITVDLTGDLDIRNGSIRANTGDAPGGDVSVYARSIFIAGDPKRINDPDHFVGIGADTNGRGKGGNIFVHASSINLQPDALIEAVSTGTGASGNVDVIVRNLNIDFGRFDEKITGQARLGSGISANYENLQPAAAGTVVGPAGNVRIGSPDRPAQIVRVLNGAGIVSRTFSSGDAGGVTIHAKHVEISGSSDKTIAGLVVQTNDAIPANAGDINVLQADTLELQNGILSAKSSGNGGNIIVQAVDHVYVFESTITANAKLDGGQITIDPEFVILRRSFIFGQNGAGTLRVNIDPNSTFIQSTDSLILADVPSLPPDIDLAGQIIQLNAALASRAAALQESCAQRFGAGFSSFVVEGRGSVPLAPGEASPSFYLQKP